MIGEPRKTDNYWDVYWSGWARGGRDAGAARAAATDDAPGDLFDGRWREFFKAELAKRPAPNIIDLACGAGVVLDRAADALKVAGSGGALLCGVDYAYHAASALRKRPAAGGAFLHGVQGRVDRPPFADGVFDIAVSQFGPEYAGPGAFVAAVRLLAAGGAAQHIIHYKDGGIYRECAQNADLLRVILETGLLEKARAVFDDGDAGAALAAANRAGEALQALLHGETSAAKRFLSRLLTDVARLLSRRRAYSPREAQVWLDAMGDETRQYCARMTSMTQAALDANAFAEVAFSVSAVGCALERAEALTLSSRPRPAAWLLTYRRSAA